jgi:hypothetical protein
MQYAYDGQIRRFLGQFMRAMSGFCYRAGDGAIVRVPVRYGDMTRQVAAIISQNSENIVQSAPFIACYIKDIKYDRSRLQDPYHVNKIHIREREWDETNQQYLNTQGANYTVERVMPSPYTINFTADIWTTGINQKLQLWEQIVVLFNPSLEIQSNDNYLDWTSLSVLELNDGSVFESRQVPQGLSNDISVASLQFTAPIWISPPAKIKKLGIVTKIIANIFAEQPGTGADGEYDDAFFSGDIFGGMTPDSRVTVTPKDFELLVLNNKAVLVPYGYTNIDDSWISTDIVPDRPTWLNILDLYPGKFTSGVSQLRLLKLDQTEIVAFMTLDPVNESVMNLTFDSDTVPSNTIITSGFYDRGTFDAVVDPQKFNPNTQAGQNIDLRYLLINDVVLNNIIGPSAWNSIGPVSGQPNGIQAYANDVIQWDGDKWNIIFKSRETQDVTYLTNSYTGIQYKWNGSEWVKSFEGIYSNSDWRMIL